MLNQKLMPDIQNLSPTQQAILLVTQYPCECCVLPKLQTTDQFSSFFYRRRVHDYIAVCWWARVYGNGDRIYSQMEEKVSSRDFYDWVCLKVLYFDALWGLCQSLAPRMVKDFAKLKPEDLAKLKHKDLGERITPLWLFKAAVMEEANGEVEISCDYIELPGRKIDTALKLKAKAVKEGLNEREARRLQKLSQQYGRKNISESLLREIATRNNRSKAIKSQFDLFMLAAANLWEKEATIARKGGTWGWNNGVPLTGTKNNVYAPLPSNP
jgi:hypothetical protein